MTDTVNANRAHFKCLEREIRKRKDFIGAEWIVDDDDDSEEDDGAPQVVPDGRRMRLLDYACGTGLISRGLTKDEMHAYQGDLTDPSAPDPAPLSDTLFRDFDVAGVGLGFHHFDDPELAARRLVERLRPGGVLIIVDFLPHEAADRGLPSAHTVKHHGFSEQRMRAIFEQAGAGGGFAMEDLGGGVVFGAHGHGDSHGHSHERGHNHDHDHGGAKAHGGKRRVFLARGTKV
ncbi:putative methyltransferase C1347.09 [Colletotrichum chlorophyti]|uniref:Putative methyltransferase C1347.09 n=1 Tax=Colletotrichum chlorophyti TaxID=708187 RepID=A0A1Q8RP42_9PEZI|nr:putative methyltransferase C1347.09 [Colletotrichum chlorophyti]